MKKISLDDVTNRIANAVLNETYINKESLLPIIRVHLKAWTTQNEYLKAVSVPNNNVAIALTRCDLEKRFFVDKIKSIVSTEELKEIYNQRDEYLKQIELKPATT
jgi:hypothetical protein